MRRASDIPRKLALADECREAWPVTEQPVPFLSSEDPREVEAGIAETLALRGLRGEEFLPSRGETPLYPVSGVRELILNKEIDRQQSYAALRYAEEYWAANDLSYPTEDAEEALINKLDAIIHLHDVRSSVFLGLPTMQRLCDLVCGEAKSLPDEGRDFLVLVLRAALDRLNAFYDSEPADFVERHYGDPQRFRKHKKPMAHSSLGTRVVRRA